MFSRKNIEQLIASVVTQSALTLPVAYIQSIVFFNDKTKIADCSWENLHQNGNFHYYGNDELGDFPINNPVVIVHAVDVDGITREFTASFGHIFE